MEPYVRVHFSKLFEYSIVFWKMEKEKKKITLYFIDSCQFLKLFAVDRSFHRLTYNNVRATISAITLLLS